MMASTWEQRASALHDAGYTRYQKRTSTMLGDLSGFLVDRYRGDLRRLRDEADRDPARERRALKEVEGLGDVGIDIFFRECRERGTSGCFADHRALKAARQLKLGDDARALSRLVDGGAELTRLVAALIRTELGGDYDEMPRRAAG